MGTVLVASVLAVIVGLILFNMFKGRRNGKSSCGCDCGHCASAGLCHGGETVKRAKK